MSDMELSATLRRTSEDWLNVSIITPVELLPPTPVKLLYSNDKRHVCAIFHVTTTVTVLYLSLLLLYKHF